MCIINNQTPCGDIYQPPSRNNMSLFGIIEIVIMIVVAIICLIEVGTFIKKMDTLKGYITVLVFIDDIIIVVAVCYLLYGLFCAVSSRNIKIGILLFVVGAVLAMVIIALQINQSSKEIWFKIFQFIILLFLTFILWQQAARV